MSTRQKLQFVASNIANRYAVVTTAFTWGTIEPNASIISACLPLYGNLFGSGKKLGFYIRSLFSRLASRSGGTGDQSGDKTARGYIPVNINGNPSHQRRD
ncbi:integral membrane protein PTH11-like [Aspergillus luchuensis]|uniref:Integral membrane protein PTH11-like n=1 Tax=Aspergillus kawachii TaxID=1069201 RepID=A0A146F5P3_ASPKA|nr:integral membrane protein PTH11-like [Aspergillus luchuensis]